MAALAVAAQAEEPKTANSTLLIQQTFNKGNGSFSKTPVDSGTVRATWVSSSAITGDGTINLKNSGDGAQACAYVDLGNAIAKGTPDSVYELEIVVKNTSAGIAILTGGFWPEQPEVDGSHDAGGCPWWYWRANGEFRASTGPGFSGDIAGENTGEVALGDFETFTFVLKLTDKNSSNNSASLYRGNSATGKLLGSAKFTDVQDFRYVGLGARTFLADDTASGVIKSITLKQILTPSESKPTK